MLSYIRSTRCITAVLFGLVAGSFTIQPVARANPAEVVSRSAKVEALRQLLEDTRNDHPFGASSSWDEESPQAQDAAAFDAFFEHSTLKDCGQLVGWSVDDCQDVQSLVAAMSGRLWRAKNFDWLSRYQGKRSGRVARYVVTEPPYTIANQRTFFTEETGAFVECLRAECGEVIAFSTGEKYSWALRWKSASNFYHCAAEVRQHKLGGSFPLSIYDSGSFYRNILLGYLVSKEEGMVDDHCNVLSMPLYVLKFALWRLPSYTTRNTRF